MVTTGNRGHRLLSTVDREGRVMEIKGLTPGQFQMIVATVSADRYDGNVVVGWTDHCGPSLLNAAGTRFHGRVIVKSSKGSGARRSASGRRMPAACWHAFRDVVRATLAEVPGATFRTMHARYDAATFERTYPETGTRNVGNLVQPVSMPELCECDDERPVTLRSSGLTTTVVETELAPADRYVSRIDATLSLVPGECGWCSKSTVGDAVIWCGQACQEAWQAAYPVGYATVH